MNIIKYIFISLLFFSFSPNADAQEKIEDKEEKEEKEEKWYKNSSIQVQFAGNIGLVSLGPTQSFFNDKINVGISLGYVPAFDVGTEIYLATFKSFYSPKLKFEYQNFSLKPISVGLAVSYTFDDRFAIYKDSKLYPDGYYWWNTNTRTGILYKVELAYQPKNKIVDAIGLYLEASFWDLGIVSIFANDNYSYIKIDDILILGLGLNLYF